MIHRPASNVVHTVPHSFCHHFLEMHCSNSVHRQQQQQQLPFYSRFTGQSALAGTSIWELEEFFGAQFYCPHALDQFWGWGKNWAVCHCYSENYKVVQRFIWADIGSIVMSMVNLYWYRQYCLFYECCSHCRFQPHGCAIICFME